MTVLSIWINTSNHMPVEGICFYFSNVYVIRQVWIAVRRLRLIINSNGHGDQRRLVHFECECMMREYVIGVLPNSCGWATIPGIKDLIIVHSVKGISIKDICLAWILIFTSHILVNVDIKPEISHFTTPYILCCYLFSNSWCYASMNL